MARARWRVALEAILWSVLVGYGVYIAIFVGSDPQNLRTTFDPGVTATMLAPALAPVLITAIATILQERYFSLKGALRVGSLAWALCFFAVLFYVIVFDVNAGGMGFSIILFLPWVLGWFLLPLGFGIAYRRLRKAEGEG
jgi:hypothetical protein